ncbi:MAG TPA: DUF2096 family protein, partial [Methanobacteriaceae archaeon]|nr:DUF2096 family protein [Methanobacteriaceae archaeon]
MSSLPAEQTWMILVELLTDLRRHKVQIPPSITRDIRLAKTTINFYKVDPTDPERLKEAKRMNEFLTSAQEALMALAECKGEEYSDSWLDKLRRAAQGEEVYPPKEDRSKFVVGAPPGFSMIRVNFKIPL